MLHIIVPSIVPTGSYKPYKRIGYDPLITTLAYDPQNNWSFGSPGMFNFLIVQAPI